MLARNDCSRAGIAEPRENRRRVRVIELHEPAHGHRLVEPERQGRHSPARILPRKQAPSRGVEVRARLYAKGKRGGRECRRTARVRAPVRDVGGKRCSISGPCKLKSGCLVRSAYE